MLEILKAENVGPLPALNIALSPRVNIFTGDNGLGKSFILDMAWWVLTRTWRDYPALPNVKTAKAKIDFSFTGKTKDNRYSSTFDSASRTWTGRVGRPANPGLVLYASVDGGFAIWDPARNYWRKKDNDNASERPPAYLFRPTQVWDGLESGGNVLCNGLIRDWALWQQKAKSPEYEHLKAALAKLSPSEAELLTPGEPTRISLDDVRDIPTLRMPYGQDVPVVHASAGMKRIMALTYLLVWAWHEHRKASELLGQPVTRQIIFLIDEVECHLHPKWQRVIMGALLSVMSALADDDKTDVQILAATHSPLLLASMEPIFEEARDAWFDIDLVREDNLSRVDIVKRAWRPHGDASAWLTSEAFDLLSARSKEAEGAIQKAMTAWREESIDTERVKAIHDQLRAVLKDTDPFWPRWLYFAEKKGVLL